MDLRTEPLTSLQVALEHPFARPGLLVEALTHPSAGATSTTPVADFERLEFLGDRVLGLLVARQLIERFPNADAGELALRYNGLVRREACTRVAQQLNLSSHLRMARGERATGGATKPAILADACEAVIGALYVDGGLDAARHFVERFWTPLLEEQAGADKDPKTLLQEWAHRKKMGPPAYNMLATEGPPHAPTFLVEAVVNGIGSSSGRGASKRNAEQEAAAALLQVGMSERGA